MFTFAVVRFGENRRPTYIDMDELIWSAYGGVQVSLLLLCLCVSKPAPLCGRHLLFRQDMWHFYFVSRKLIYHCFSLFFFFFFSTSTMLADGEANIQIIIIIIIICLDVGVACFAKSCTHVLSAIFFFVFIILCNVKCAEGYVSVVRCTPFSFFLQFVYVPRDHEESEHWTTTK